MYYGADGCACDRGLHSRLLSSRNPEAAPLACACDAPQGTHTVHITHTGPTAQCKSANRFVAHAFAMSAPSTISAPSTQLKMRARLSPSGKIIHTAPDDQAQG